MIGEFSADIVERCRGVGYARVVRSVLIRVRDGEVPFVDGRVPVTPDDWAWEFRLRCSVPSVDPGCAGREAAAAAASTAHSRRPRALVQPPRSLRWMSPPCDRPVKVPWGANWRSLRRFRTRNGGSVRRSEVVLRSWMRRWGLAKHVKRLAYWRGSPEAAVKQKFDEDIRPGDMVWDVGANGGWYSVRFAKLAGPQGKVWAFEPVPNALEPLRQRLTEQGVQNVVVVPIAVGENSTMIKMQVDPVLPGGSVYEMSGVRTGMPTLTASTDPPSIIDVQMKSGDDFRSEADLPVPQFIKIDVEGFELDVLKGLRGTLVDDNCRSVMVEVHFALLEARGYRDAPLEVERLLREFGFATKWVDRSHIWATKSPT